MRSQFLFGVLYNAGYSFESLTVAIDQNHHQLQLLICITSKFSQKENMMSSYGNSSSPYFCTFFNESLNVYCVCSEDTCLFTVSSNQHLTSRDPKTFIHTTCSDLTKCLGSDGESFFVAILMILLSIIIVRLRVIPRLQ